TLLDGDVPHLEQWNAHRSFQSRSERRCRCEGALRGVRESLTCFRAMADATRAISSTAGTTSATAAAVPSTAHVLLEVFGLFRARKREIVERDQQTVALRKRVHERPRIAVRPAQVMNNGLPAVEQDLHIEDFHRQV